MELSEIIDLTRELCEAPGISGREEGAAEAAERLLGPLGKVERTPLGSLLCTVCPGKKGAPHLMLEAHLDQIGMVVTSLEKGGFLRVANVGGLDRRLLPASPVTVHARDGRHPAVVASVPPHLSGGKEKPLKMEGVLLDTGLPEGEARELFAPGDPVTLDSRFAQLAGGLLTGGSLDNRAGCAAVIAAARMLRKGSCRARVTLCLASQEETSGFGASTAAFALAPDLALITDVTFGDGFGVKPQECGKVGGGVEIDYAPAVDRRIFDRLRELAREEGIPWQLFAMGSGTGTDTDLIAAAGKGVRCGLLSIPLRNMHTAVETVSAQDILDTARLMAAFAREVE